MKKHFQPRSWEWIDSNYFVCRERELSSDKQRLDFEGSHHPRVKGHHRRPVLCRTVVQSPEYKAVADDHRICNIEFHKDYFTQSSRNQDLGHDGQKRMLVGSQIIKEKSPVHSKERRIVQGRRTLGGSEDQGRGKARRSI